MKKRLFILLLVVAVFALGVVLLLGNGKGRKNSPPKAEPKKETELKIKEKGSISIEAPRVSIIVRGLEIPWGLAFLPDGRLLFTERPGRVGIIDKEGNSSSVAEIPQVKHIGEGGLLGIAAHPDFKNNKYIYFYYTYSSTGSDTLNRVTKFKFEDDKLTNEEIIVDAIPGAANHNGGRIKFGPDDFLYITTGDAQNPSLAQNTKSLAGKILRVTDQGKPAPGNPFDNLVYSYGHRNSQGITWDNNGRLWATEHGRSGIQSGLDELNLIEKGKNYGWPTIQGDERKEGMVTPIIHSGPNDTWAPAGAVFYDDRIFFAGLRGESLFEYKIADKSLKKHFKGEFGRIRAVVLGIDNYLYITTSNRDGRGIAREGDDKIIKINPQKL